MKWFLITLIMGMAFLFTSASGFAEIKKKEIEEPFSTKGTLTRVETDGKTFSLKNEGGLELTFHTNEATQVRIGEESKSFNDLAVGDRLEIDYLYNENYEKVARSIRKQFKT